MFVAGNHTHDVQPAREILQCTYGHGRPPQLFMFTNIAYLDAGAATSALLVKCPRGNTAEGVVLEQACSENATVKEGFATAKVGRALRAQLNEMNEESAVVSQV